MSQQIQLVVCGKPGVGKTSIIDRINRLVEGEESLALHFSEVELKPGQESMERVVGVTRELKARHPQAALKLLLVIAASDRALEVEKCFLAEGLLKGAIVALNKIDTASPVRQWTPQTFDPFNKEDPKAQNIDLFATFVKRSLLISNDGLALCSVPEDEESYGVQGLLNTIIGHQVLREKTNDEIPKKRELVGKDKSSWNPIENAAIRAIQEASSQLTKEVIPELDRTLRTKTLVTLEDVLNGFIRELRVQLNVLLENQMESSSKLIVQVKELTGQVNQLLENLGPNTERVAEQFRLISKDASGVVEQIIQISDGVGSHLSIIEPLAQKLTTNIHEVSVPLAGLAETLERLATRVQEVMPPPGKTDEPGALDKMSGLLEKHGTLLEELVNVGDRYISMEEKKHRFGSEAAMEKMVLLLGSGIFFMILSRFFSSSPANAFTLLRVGWGAIAVTGLFTFARPLWTLLKIVKEDEGSQKLAKQSLAQLFWKKVQSEEMVGYVFYILFILLISGLTLVPQ